MDIRFRGLPGELVRRTRAKAGDRLQEVMTGLLRAYIDGLIDPLAEGRDPVAIARGAKGGAARAANLSDAERTASARHAVTARWAQRDRIAR